MLSPVESCPQPLPVPRIQLASAPKALQWTCAHPVVTIGTTVHKNMKTTVSTVSTMLPLSSERSESLRDHVANPFDGNSTRLLHFGGLQGLTSNSQPILMSTMCQATVANASATSRVQLCQPCFVTTPASTLPICFKTLNLCLFSGCLILTREAVFVRRPPCYIGDGGGQYANKLSLRVYNKLDPEITSVSYLTQCHRMFYLLVSW